MVGANADEADEDDPGAVVDPGHERERVTADVKDDPVVPKTIGLSECRLDRDRVRPGSGFVVTIHALMTGSASGY